METLHDLILGFSVSLSPLNLLYCFIGVLLGTVVGVLPGLGASATIALLLPITFYINDTSAIIMLAGIWYGSMYGGSTTSILLRIPGEAASVVTCLDGYEMAKKGRGGPALGISAFGSFIAGTLGILGLMLLAPPLAEFSLKFGPPEYFGLTMLGLTLVAYLAQGSMLKALIMVAVGLFLGTIGLDAVESRARFTYNTYILMNGLELVPIAMGLFGISEVLGIIDEKSSKEEVAKPPKGLLAFLPNKKDWRDSTGAIARGTILGFLVGIIPGGGATISSFVAYAVEKRFSRHPEKFGTGLIEAVAAPESANNSATAGAFIPLLSLGIPSNVIMALMLGALMLHGITPGPMLLKQRPDMFWGVVTSMYVGNIMLLILNLPLIGLFTQITKVPEAIMGSIITMVCLLGAYVINNNPMDILIMIIFGILGYLLKKFKFEAAPLLLAFILGPMIEISLRQSLITSRGSFMIFFSRPISGVLLGLAIFLLITPSMRKYFKSRTKNQYKEV